MNQNKSKIDCQKVEEILFKNDFENLTSEKQILVKNHLSKCSKCAASKKILTTFDTILKKEFDKSSLLPQVQSKQDLIRRFNLNKKQKRNIKDVFLDFFEIKIPLYQVISILLIIGAITIFVNKKETTFNSVQNNQFTIAAIDSNNNFPSFQNSLDLINSQNKGRSFLEDSVLASFIQSTM